MGQNRNFLRIAALGAALVLGSAFAAPAAVADRPVVTTEVNHFVSSQYFPPDPDCGGVGVTEVATGTDRLQVVDMGETLHVTFSETFRIREIADDPALPITERQGTDALTFHLIRDGDVEIFHESFHDKPTVWGDIAFYTTLVTVKGEVRVDHFFGRNLPDEGC